MSQKYQLIHNVRRQLLSLASIISIVALAGLPASAATTGTTVLSQQVTPGTLSLTNAASASLTNVPVSSSPQTSTGSLGTVAVTDSRGSGLGWTNTATCTNFSQINPAVVVAGSNNTVTSGGSYTGSAAGTYTITIQTVGPSGVAAFTVSGLETQSLTTTGSNVAIGTKGVTASFGAATYVAGNAWTIRVDTIPVTDLTLIPSSVTTVSGTSTGVTPGSAHTFTGIGDATTIMAASANNGNGTFSDNPNLSLTVPASTFANTYTATLTETVQ